MNLDKTTGAANRLAPGLEGIIAAQTRLSRVDGQKGELIVAGFPIETLASQASFEEVVYLLWYGHLPTATEFKNFRGELAELRQIPQATVALLRAAAVQKQSPMDALRMAAGTLDLDVEPKLNPDINPMDLDRQARLLIARLPTLVATYWRLLADQPPIAPDRSLGHAANYLYMLTGTVPSDARLRSLETYLNTVMDHGLNASTFAARVIIATRSDLVSAIVGAIGALKGPLHGGAPSPALDMVFEIGAVARAEPYLRAKLEQGERLMGFGHRIYKVRDPRATVLAAAADTMYQLDGDMALYTLAKEVEAVAIRLLADYKPGRKLQTNVEFYTALLLHGLGLHQDLFTPTFAIGRTAGWIAHTFEQWREGRLIRPKAAYIGVEDRLWRPIHAR